MRINKLTTQPSLKAFCVSTFVVLVLTFAVLPIEASEDLVSHHSAADASLTALSAGVRVAAVASSPVSVTPSAPGEMSQPQSGWGSIMFR